MKLSAVFAALFISTLALVRGSAAEASASVGPTVAQLAFLTGTWHGTASTGRTAEEMISTAEGGVMVSAAREFKDGRCVFFDLSVLAVKAGVLTLQPYPNGKMSKDAFPATSVDVAAKRAVFENPEHDFPKKFVYEVIEAGDGGGNGSGGGAAGGGERLKITLSGEVKGKMVEEVFDLKRVK